MNHWGCFLVFSLKIVTISHRSTYREGRANRSSNPNRLMRHVRVDHLWCHVRLLCVLISITADRRRGDRTAEGEGGNGRTEGHNPWKSQQTPPPEVVMLGSGCADQLGPTRWHLNWSTYRRMCLVRVAVVPVFTATGTGRRFGTGAVESSRRNRGGPGEVDSKTPPFWTTFDLETWDTEGIRKQGPSYTYTNLRARYFWLEGPHRRRLL